MIDVAYIVRPGNVNEELRYSLRSLRNVPHGDVWIFGHCPPWVTNVRHVFAAQQDPGVFKYANGSMLLRLAAERVTGPFALFNDDFYCIRPVDAPPSPAHRGPLRSLADGRGTGGYASMLRDTAVMLEASGIAEPLAYTLHMPMTMTPGDLTTILDYGEHHRDGRARLSWRSLYGNLCRVGGDRVEDVKVHADAPMPPGPWVSTSDASFRYHVVGARVRAALPGASPYEL